MYIYIMRHGETQWNIEGRIQGSSDIELTEYGRELAQITAEGLCRDGIRFERIFTSPLRRAEETARIVAQKTCDPVSGPELYVDERLREMAFGHYEGEILKELRQQDPNIGLCFSEPAGYVPDEMGESYEDVFKRVNEFMDSRLIPLQDNPEIENVLVICHGAVMRAFLRRIDGLALNDFWKIKQPNCCINQFELRDNVFATVRKNILYYDQEERKKSTIF